MIKLKETNTKNISSKSKYNQLQLTNQWKKNNNDEIRKIATGQKDDYTTGCLLDYQYFKDHYNLIQTCNFSGLSWNSGFTML